jgi:hypothetical protein
MGVLKADIPDGEDTCNEPYAQCCPTCDRASLHLDALDANLLTGIPFLWVGGY